jgi:hypothetical protein
MVFPRLVLAGIGLVVPLAAYAQSATDFATLARSAGQPQIPGLRIVYLTKLGNPAQAPWRNIILHQTEGAPGSARGMAEAQAKHPVRRGVTLWVETDGTVYWATPETIVTTHGDGANRNDDKYIDNSKTYRQVTRVNSIGVEFNGNAPDVRAPPTPEQFAASLLLVRFLQERYSHPGRAHLRPQLDRLQRCALLRGLRARIARPRSGLSAGAGMNFPRLRTLCPLLRGGDYPRSGEGLNRCRRAAVPISF